MTTTSSQPASSSFHEWPLVVFTTAATTGAGLLATPLVAWLAAGTTAPAADAVAWGALLLGTGIVVSLAHLGRPLRAPLASLGLGRSRLSAEIVVAGIALVLGLATAMLPTASPALDLATAAAAAALLGTLGFVYNLPGQQTWRGAASWLPLTSGLGFSAVAFAAIWRETSVAIGPIAAVALGADTALMVARWISLVTPRTALNPRYPSIFARRQTILAVRFALVDFLPGICLLAEIPAAAAGLLGIGILADRIGFYGFASQHTTEAEMRQVEAVVGSRV